MFQSIRFIGRRAAPILLVALLGCGVEGKPRPAYSDPCSTPMSGVLGCPAGSTILPAATVEEACRKLTECGILADTFYSVGGTDCTQSESCTAEPDGKCLPNAEGQPHCAYHYLDYFWCVLGLTEPGRDPCDTDGQPPHISFDQLHVEAAVACIDTTSCDVLGAPFAAKRAPHPLDQPSPADPDKFVCKSNGATTIWTATTCDFGLLEYDSRTPQP